jgi:NADH:ubiquinone oxidoreductase subunit C
MQTAADRPGGRARPLIYPAELRARAGRIAFEPIYPMGSYRDAAEIIARVRLSTRNESMSSQSTIWLKKHFECEIRRRSDHSAVGGQDAV